MAVFGARNRIFSILGNRSTGEGGGSGQPGLSAYQVAVNNGFTGSESEWLESLVGPPVDALVRNGENAFPWHYLTVDDTGFFLGSSLDSYIGIRFEAGEGLGPTPPVMAIRKFNGEAINDMAGELSIEANNRVLYDANGDVVFNYSLKSNVTIPDVSSDNPSLVIATNAEDTGYRANAWMETNERLGQLAAALSKVKEVLAAYNLIVT